jgi:hypothetical protein
LDHRAQAVTADALRQRGFARNASWLCAALAGGMLALHFNGEVAPGWTRGLSYFAGWLALAGAALAAYALGRQGWASLRYWLEQLALGVNLLLGLSFLFYATPS